MLDRQSAIEDVLRAEREGDEEQIKIHIDTLLQGGLSCTEVDLLLQRAGSRSATQLAAR